MSTQLNPLDLIAITDSCPSHGAGILCPVCQFDYVHPARVLIDAGGVLTEVTSQGTSVSTRIAPNQPGQLDPAGRGVVIKLGCWCENGHSFEVVFRFHKGNLFMEVAKLADGNLPQETIWRD